MHCQVEALLSSSLTIIGHPMWTTMENANFIFLCAVMQIVYRISWNVNRYWVIVFCDCQRPKGLLWIGKPKPSRVITQQSWNGLWNWPIFRPSVVGGVFASSVFFIVFVFLAIFARAGFGSRLKCCRCARFICICSEVEYDVEVITRNNFKGYTNLN